MTYLFNGKNVRIPDEDIARTMDGLKVSKEEAIEIWLEDEGYLDNEEQDNLDTVAKANKVNVSVGKSAKKERKPRETKIDEEKAEILCDIYKFLMECEFENVKITNISKIIEFDFGENHYKLDLIKQRKPKN